MPSDTEPEPASSASPGLAFERARRDRQRMLEHDEIELDWARLSLGEALVEMAERGDVVRLSVTGRSWTGAIVHVGEDLATILTATDDRVDIALARLESVRVVEAGRAGGRPVGGHPHRLEARLRELVVSGETVELSVGEGLRARIRAVAADHVRVEAPDAAQWLVPTSSIAWLERLR